MTNSCWVGWFGAGGTPAFIGADLAGGRVSLPARGWFGVPAAVDAPLGRRVRLSFAADGLRARLDGEAAAGLETRPDGEAAAGLEARPDGEAAASLVAGTATVNGQAGRFELWPATPLAAATYRRFVSHFEGAGRAVSLHLQSDTFFGEPMAFYREGDAIVRLHPAPGQRLLSERAELVGLHGGEPGFTAYLTFASPGQPGPPARLEEVPRWNEEEVAFPGPAGRIAGTLMTPPTSAPHAAIALVHGAAGGRRDFYRVFGEQFVRAGLAALVYDKRGHGRSEGASGESTMLDRSLDAEAALAFLRTRPGITTTGLYGFSNGAWSVPMVTGRRQDVGFVVVMGAPGVTPARSEVHRKVFELREQGVPEPECAMAATVWELIYRYHQTGAWDDADSEVFDHAALRLRDSEAIAGVRLQQYAIDNPFLSPIPPYRGHRDLLQQPVPHQDTDWSYDPIPDYRRTSCPVLFTVGELDQNLPGRQSAERVREVLTGAAHRDSVVRVFPGTGHLMNVVDGGLHGMTSEEASYRFHRFRFAPGFLELLRGWSRARAGAG